jgi:phage shock protein PspC (stress-responsive transcriptional regulator)
MKQVININFQGRVVPIEVTAFELLKNYTESLNKHFANEQGKDEIINDIESRIGELFQERLKNGATCITDDDVNAVIKSMGRPEEFAEFDETSNQINEQKSQQQSTNFQNTATGSRRLYRDEESKILGGVCSGIGNYFNIDPWVPRIILIVTAFAGVGLFAYLILWAFLPSSSTKVIGGVRKKLYRDADDKLIAGVCSGIGNYFGFSAWIPRVLFLLPFISFVFNRGHWGGIFGFDDFVRFTFSPGSLIIYIILWLVIPEANTTSEKLEMKGEKVDIDSIKNSVMEEMKGVQQKAEKFGKEATAFATASAQKVNTEVTNAVKRNRSSVGDVIAIILKAFAYFIIGSIAIGLLIGLFGFAIGAIGLLPLKDFVVRDGWQNVLAWGTLLFFIILPLIGAITWIIRRIAKTRANSKIIRWGFGAGWTLGWICFFAFISLFLKDFRAQNKIEEDVLLSNPKVSQLEISSSTTNSRYYGKRWFKFESFNGTSEDSMLLGNMQVRIKKATNDSFRVVLSKISNGVTGAQARELAQKINFTVQQKDSLLLADKGFEINKTDKFRNQHVILTVYVPVGKKIKINKNFGWWNNVEVDGPWVNNDSEEEYWNNNDNWYQWQKGITYIMKEDGLYDINGNAINTWKNGKNKVKIGPDGIRVKDNNTDVNITPSGIDIIENDNDNDTYRYDGNNNTGATAVDSLKQKQQAEKQRLSDSINRALQKAEAEKEKLEQMKEKMNSGGVLLQDVPLLIPMHKFFVIDQDVQFN